MEMHWGWLIVVYLFMGGLGGGAFLTSFAAERGWIRGSRGIQKTGYLIAAPIITLGSIILVFDLGQGLKQPQLIFGMLANLSSIMTWGVYILSLFILVGFIAAYFSFSNKQVPAPLSWLGALLALSTVTYTGLLLYVIKAIPLWNSILMPILFVVSAISTGLSATLLLSSLLFKDNGNEASLGKVHSVLLALELIVLAIFFSTLLSGASGPVAQQSGNMILFGSLSLISWIGLIALGLLLPLMVFAYTSLGKSRLSHAIVLSSDGLVLLGGFTLRYLVIFGALPIWSGSLL